MLRPVWRSLILLILLIPSAQFAWRDRDMRDFAYLHDDGVFFVTAKSVAGNSLRIESLPEQPEQTKFPPLYPFYLSLVWRVNPNFPSNLPLATLLSWICLAALLPLTWLLYRREGLLETRAWIFVAVMAVNPYLILFGTRMFSEVFFMCWVIAAFVVLARGGIRAAAIAGVLAGCAYLSRTAGVALFISVPAILLWKRDIRRAGAFAAAMLPFVLGWTLWSQTHMPASLDDTLRYYVDYVGYRSLNFGLDNIAVILWKNIDQILYGIGALVLPKVAESLPVKILTQVIAFAMIAGVVRLVRRGVMIQYAAFAVISIGTLLVWHFPPNERLLLPVLPLLVAGLLAELEHLARMLRASFSHRDASQRVAAGIFSVVVAAIFGTALVLQGFMTFQFLHAAAQEKTAKLRDLRAAYAWMSANIPASATVLSYDDPLLYLYTGFRGNYLPLMPRWWYAEDHASIQAAYLNVTGYCQSRGLSYVLFTSEDLSRETGDEDRQAIQQSVRENPQLHKLFQSGIATVYAVEGL